MRRRAGALRQDVTGVVRLGLNNEAVRLHVPEILAVMTRRHPGVELHLVNSSSPRILDNVRLGRLDVGFVYDNIIEAGHEVAVTPPGRGAHGRGGADLLGRAGEQGRLRTNWPACPGVWFPSAVRSICSNPRFHAGDCPSTR